MKGAGLLLDNPTRVLFFTGKGGVGKTSLACAEAIELAGRGRRVLLVSTDPASNLDEVLETKLSSEPTAVVNLPDLFALNLDPEMAARAYRDRVVGPYRGILPEAALASMEEQLSGACTVEIAAFDEFTKLLADPETKAGFNYIIFDTAPTGHTLRLLSLPGAWTEFINTNTTGTSCLGPLAGLTRQRALYQASLDALSDPQTTTIVLVGCPDPSALEEAERTRVELRDAGLAHQIFALNGLFTARDADDAVARALEARGRRAIAEMPAGLAALPRVEIPLLASAPMGVENLRLVFSPGEEIQGGCAREAPSDPDVPGLMPLIDEIEKPGRGVILSMGKGGVGKTTIAAAIAVELARRGHRVHLSTTDPAAHVAMTVRDQVPGLRVSRIDPKAETWKYSREVMEQAGQHLDTKGRALLEEDLRSPCTEEIAVFRAFARIVAEGEGAFVVLDTAPTGHTLLLLDAAQAYHREVSRVVGDAPEAVRRLLPRLRDGDFAKVILVALPEATPVHEAARLQGDLLRAGIKPFAWVVNQSFVASGSRDPLLVRRGERELPYLREVRDQYARRVALIPWKAEDPVGAAGLLGLLHRDEHQESPVIP